MTNISKEELQSIKWLKFYNEIHSYIKDNYIIEYLNYRSTHYDLNNISNILLVLYNDNKFIKNSLELIVYLDDMDKYYKYIILSMINLSNRMDELLNKLKENTINYILDYDIKDFRVD